MRSLPDGLTGAIMAVEGILDACVLLHGPGGCRVRHMVHASAAFPRFEEAIDHDFAEPFFFGYPRVPGTYLDGYDFINGAVYKLGEGLETVGSRQPGLVAIIDSPGATLIGDDHRRALGMSGMDCPCVILDSPLASAPMPLTVDRTLRRVMETLDPPSSERRPRTVVLIGLSILDKDWMSARDELCGLLASMGLEVVCCPGAGSSVEGLRSSVDAEFAVVVCPEMCSDLAEYYRERGLKVIESESGAPVGLDATEGWIRAVADATGANPSPALEKVEACRARIRDRFIGMRYNSSRIRGLTFSVAGTASVVDPLTRWLYTYLAMAPIAVMCDDGGDPRHILSLKEFLESAGYGGSFGREPETGSDVVLCEGITAITMELRGDCATGIPIGHSSMGLDDMIPRPVYGLGGTLYILDEILHGVRGT